MSERSGDPRVIERGGKKYYEFTLHADMHAEERKRKRAKRREIKLCQALTDNVTPNYAEGVKVEALGPAERFLLRLMRRGAYEYSISSKIDDELRQLADALRTCKDKRWVLERLGFRKAQRRGTTFRRAFYRSPALRWRPTLPTP
jgi:hypothetical protein